MPVSEMVATQQEMDDARLPLHFRDYCAHKLIPLNECRRATLFMPWKCEHERHVYEKCNYLEYKKRVEALAAQEKAESSVKRF